MGWKHLNSVFFSYLPFRRYRRYLHVSQKTTWVKCTLIFEFKKFLPLNINASCFLLKHQWAFELSVIVAYESLIYAQYEKMDLKIIQSLLERAQIHKNAETKEFVGPEWFFWRTAGRLTIQHKQGSHLQLSLKQKHTKKTAVDHSGNNTVLRIKRI